GCHRLLEGGMAPAAVLLELLRRVHRVVDQELRVREECDEVVAPRRRSVVMAPGAELVVGHVRHARAPPGRRPAIHQRRAGVPPPHSAHEAFAYRELAALRVDLSYLQLSRQGSEWGREPCPAHL